MHQSPQLLCAPVQHTAVGEGKAGLVIGRQHGQLLQHLGGHRSHGLAAVYDPLPPAEQAVLHTGDQYGATGQQLMYVLDPLHAHLEPINL